MSKMTATRPTIDLQNLFNDPLLNEMLGQAVDQQDQEKIITLVRVLGATNHWCSDAKCGPCPLAINGCRDNSDKMVRKFVKKYKAALTR
jgi:hypothetical protein